MESRGEHRRSEPPLPRTTLERILKGLVVVAVPGMFVGAAVAWPDLPDRIPVHFGLSGRPDRWGSRVWIWLLPSLAALVTAGLSLLERHPRIYNYRVPIHDENRATQYRLARELVVQLEAAVVLLFGWLEWIVLDSAVRAGTRPDVTPILLAAPVLLLLPLVYWIRARRAG